MHTDRHLHHQHHLHTRPGGVAPIGVAPLDTTPLGTTPLGTVLAVWAHPDDESFVAGGLLAAASDSGSRVVCLTATRGERGTTDAERWCTSRLARTRTRELAAAHAILGIADQRWLPFDDGDCHAVSPGHGMALVARAIAEVQPDTIVTFGPDGLTGHTDHQAVSRWTSHAWAATRSPARLLWAAITVDAQRRMAEVEPVANAFYPGYPRVTSDRSVAVRLDLTGDLLDRKFSAMRAHATQSAALVQRMGEDRYRRWWSTETYIDVGATAAISPDRQAAPARRTLARQLEPAHTRHTTRSTQCSTRSWPKYSPATAGECSPRKPTRCGSDDC
jgi:LmbE family N-acetylglucosaminyl deacetylase